MQLSTLLAGRRRTVAAVLLLVVAAVFVLRQTGSHGSRPLAPPLVHPAAKAARPHLVVVDVVGEVRRPGLLHLPAGTRIADAVAAAGGMTRKADGALVNLAAPLADGEQVVVPARGSGALGAAGAAAGTAPVDLNSATAEQLDGLPGVGPSTAAKIIAFRLEHGPFHSVEELDAVPGIGPARIEQLKGLVLP